MGFLNLNGLSRLPCAGTADAAGGLLLCANRVAAQVVNDTRTWIYVAAFHRLNFGVPFSMEPCRWAERKNPSTPDPSRHELVPSTQQDLASDVADLIPPWVHILSYLDLLTICDDPKCCTYRNKATATPAVDTERIRWAIQSLCQHTAERADQLHPPSGPTTNHARQGKKRTGQIHHLSRPPPNPKSTNPVLPHQATPHPPHLAHHTPAFPTTTHGSYRNPTTVEVQKSWLSGDHPRHHHFCLPSTPVYGTQHQRSPQTTKIHLLLLLLLLLLLHYML